jgi:hypothetical protein
MKLGDTYLLGTGNPVMEQEHSSSSGSEENDVGEYLTQYSKRWAQKFS